MWKIVTGVKTCRDCKRKCYEATIKEFLLTKIILFKIPKEWYFVDEIPYTNSGKIARMEAKVSLKIRRKYMNRAVIVEAKRTPIGKKNGMLKDYEVQQLAAPLLHF